MNQACIDLVKKFEGCKLTAYRDMVGVWTVGYGCTGDDVSEGLQITQEEADKRLATDLEAVERGVSRLVKVPLTDNQLAALVSFTYNLGIGSLWRSTLLRKLNAGDYAGASDEFVKWDRAGGVPVAGLTRRRLAEQQLFRS